MNCTKALSTRSTSVRLSSLLALVPICTLLAGGPAAAEPDPCVGIDAASFDGLLGIIDDGVTAAEADFSANGVSGDYAVASQYSRDYLVRARQKVAELQAWMVSTGLDASNASTAANVHLYLSEAITALQVAAWWGLVSASYHNSVLARDAFERAMEATGRANEIGTVGGRCYVSHYLTP